MLKDLTNNQPPIQPMSQNQNQNQNNLTAADINFNKLNDNSISQNNGFASLINNQPQPQPMSQPQPQPQPMSQPQQPPISQNQNNGFAPLVDNQTQTSLSPDKLLMEVEAIENDFPKIKEGFYQTNFASIELKATNSGKEMITITYKITNDEKYTGQLLFDNYLLTGISESFQKTNISKLKFRVMNTFGIPQDKFNSIATLLDAVNSFAPTLAQTLFNIGVNYKVVEGVESDFPTLYNITTNE